MWALEKRKYCIIELLTNLGTITAPPLPTSSKGWISPEWALQIAQWFLLGSLKITSQCRLLASAIGRPRKRFAADSFIKPLMIELDCHHAELRPGAADVVQIKQATFLRPYIVLDYGLIRGAPLREAMKILSRVTNKPISTILYV